MCQNSVSTSPFKGGLVAHVEISRSNGIFSIRSQKKTNTGVRSRWGGRREGPVSQVQVQVPDFQTDVCFC